MIRGIIFPTQDVAAVQGRGQLGFDIEVEEFAVHRPVDDPGRIQPVMAQCGNEGPAPEPAPAKAGVIRGPGLPVAEGGVIHQSRPAWRPAGRLGHVGLERPSTGKLIPRINFLSRLDVDKPYACQHVTHEGLTTADPDIARQRDIRPLLLDRAQVFFCVSA